MTFSTFVDLRSCRSLGDRFFLIGTTHKLYPPKEGLTTFEIRGTTTRYGV